MARPFRRPSPVFSTVFLSFHSCHQVEAAAVQAGLADRLVGGAHVLQLTDELAATVATKTAAEARAKEAHVELEKARAAHEAERAELEARVEQQLSAMANMSARMKDMALAHEASAASYKTEVELLKSKHSRAAGQLEDEVAATKRR